MKHSGAKNRRNKREIMSSKIEILKICECCGKTFVAHKSTTRYCSHKCNSKAYKNDKREYKLTAISYNMAKDIERISNQYEKIKDKEFLSVSETAFLLSVGRTTVYRYLHEGSFKAVQIGNKTFIRRSDIDEKFDKSEEYKPKLQRAQKSTHEQRSTGGRVLSKQETSKGQKPTMESRSITEFYTIADIKEKYKVKESWIYNIVRENKIPKTLIKGKSYISKTHIDKHFAKKMPDSSITEWYSVDDIKEKYGMTENTIYNFVYENNIPKKKEGRVVYYSKTHVDILKNKDNEVFITTEEAMQQYNLTRDALYHYVKYHKIPKLKAGRYIKISKQALDKVLTPII